MYLFPRQICIWQKHKIRHYQSSLSLSRGTALQVKIPRQEERNHFSFKKILMGFHNLMEFHSWKLKGSKQKNKKIGCFVYVLVAKIYLCINEQNKNIWSILPIFIKRNSTAREEILSRKGRKHFNFQKWVMGFLNFEGIPQLQAKKPASGNDFNVLLMYLFQWHVYNG